MKIYFVLLLVAFFSIMYAYYGFNWGRAYARIQSLIAEPQAPIVELQNSHEYVVAWMLVIYYILAVIEASLRNHNDTDMFAEYVRQARAATRMYKLNRRCLRKAKTPISWDPSKL